MPAAGASKNDYIFLNGTAHMFAGPLNLGAGLIVQYFNKF